MSCLDQETSFGKLLPAAFDFGKTLPKLPNFTFGFLCNEQDQELKRIRCYEMEENKKILLSAKLFTSPGRF